MRTTTLRSSISSFGPFCSNGSEPRSCGISLSRESLLHTPTKNFIRNDPREDTPHRTQRETLLVPKGGNRVLEEAHGAGKIEGRR